MNLAIVGCGFVADYYMATLPLHPELRLLGVMDRDGERAEHLAKTYGVGKYATLDELLEDSGVELVLNLTNPRNHFEVSKAALLAGKHVYSEKPLAMEMAQAAELVRLAESRGLAIASAPCSILGETAQAVWKVLREGKMGTVRVVYAEMDDGMVPLMQHGKWLSVSGVPWPSKDEFEVGCTLEHAGYYLNWLAAWFGPATTVTSFASVQLPDKLPGVALDMDSPDFSVACIQFASGVVARLTCSLLAPHDHTLKIVTDRGVVYTDDCWDYRSPVYSRSMVTIRRKTFLNPLRKRYRLPKTPYKKPKTPGAATMDYARGPAELAESVRLGRACRLSPRFSLHVNEMALAIHWARELGATYHMTTTFEPMEPMEWAK
jgi:predicted dehydrogenase